MRCDDARSRGRGARRLGLGLGNVPPTRAVPLLRGTNRPRGGMASARRVDQRLQWVGPLSFDGDMERTDILDIH